MKTPRRLLPLPHAHARTHIAFHIGCENTHERREPERNEGKPRLTRRPVSLTFDPDRSNRSNFSRCSCAAEVMTATAVATVEYPGQKYEQQHMEVVVAACSFFVFKSHQQQQQQQQHSGKRKPQAASLVRCSLVTGWGGGNCARVNSISCGSHCQTLGHRRHRPRVLLFG